jgi:hypothetical protein
MSPRGSRVPRPPSREQWDLRFGKRDAADGWEQACNQWQGACAQAWDDLTTDPRRHTPRQHQLKGGEAYLERGRERHEQWQYELTGAARIHYTIDDRRRVVWFEAVYLGHPKKTERVKGRKRG